MALKFYKVLQGLTGLFKSNGRTIQSATSPSTTTIDNLTDAATTAGVNKDSIVITQATANDAAQYGGKFLPGTNVMFANGQTFVDATNIVQGVYTKLFNGSLCFCAPVGSFLETDVVQFARVANLTTGDGIVIPDETTDTVGSAYIKWVLHPIDSGDADGRRNDVRIYTVKVFQKTDAVETLATNVTINDYVAGTGLKLNDVAFSVYRNGVQITNWFQWVWNGERLVRSKGLYLPGIKEVKYEKLVKLRDGSKLVPGRYYKIIDYYPTTSVPYMTDGVFELKDRGVLTTNQKDKADGVMVSSHWQIIVQALAKDRLNEDAIAFNGGSKGDGQVCQIKYHIDTDYMVDPTVGVSTIIKSITYNGHTYNRSLNWDVSNFFEAAKTEALTSYCNVYEWEDWTSTMSDPRFLCLRFPYISEGVKTLYGASDASKTATASQIQFQNVELTYCSATSTGWIYWMKDQNGNEVCYDFKNLKVAATKMARLLEELSLATYELATTGTSPSLLNNLQKYWTFSNIDDTDLSSTTDGSCVNNVIRTKIPNRNIIMGTKIENCQVLEDSHNCTIFSTFANVSHATLARAQNCYVTSNSQITHLKITGNNNIISSNGQIAFTNILNGGNTILAEEEIKNVNTQGYYGGDHTLLGGSFQHVSFTGFCRNVKIMGATVNNTSQTGTLSGYILYGTFSEARNIRLNTNGYHFTNFTFMPGDYKANFATPTNTTKEDQGSYTFIGGNYNTNKIPAETNGMWNTEITLTRANTINNLYAPSASNFTLL